MMTKSASLTERLAEVYALRGTDAPAVRGARRVRCPSCSLLRPADHLDAPAAHLAPCGVPCIFGSAHVANDPAHLWLAHVYGYHKWNKCPACTGSGFNGARGETLDAYNKIASSSTTRKLWNAWSEAVWISCRGVRSHTVLRPTTARCQRVRALQIAGMSISRQAGALVDGLRREWSESAWEDFRRIVRRASRNAVRDGSACSGAVMLERTDR